MKTAIKPLLLDFFKDLIFYVGASQIVNAVSFIITGKVVIEGPVFQVVSFAIFVLVLRWIPRYDNWLDRKLKR